MGSKKYLVTNVYEEAVLRVKYVFENFGKICVSFSGGKDSSVLLHIACDEARERGRKIHCLFIDWECQLTTTTDYVSEIIDKYEDCLIPYWVCLEIKTDNSFSQLEPEFISWEKSKNKLWVRDKPNIAVSEKLFDFYYPGITFEEFIGLFGEWYSQSEKAAILVGIRTQESLNRFRAIIRDKENYDQLKHTTKVGDQCWNFYPIYDWQTEDVWKYNGVSKKPYNPLYDIMNKAGLSIHQQRIDEPFGDTQRETLWLYQVIEPDLWAKFISRISGVNTAALYCRTKGSVLGNGEIVLPAGHNWESFSNFILSTMPRSTSEHYKNKIAKYVNWYSERGYPDGIPDSADIMLENKGEVPSWRKICKTLLRNDYWCRWLGFSPTKSSAYDKYVKRMRKKRKEWKIYDS